MNTPECRAEDPGFSAKESTAWLRDHSRRIMTMGVILAILYLGRSVLMPLALAIMLSLLIAPLVRVLTRLRIGRPLSVLISVAALIVSCAGMALALGTQVLRIAESLPQYESNIQGKLKALEQAAAGPLLKVTDETHRLTGETPPTALAVPTSGVERRPLQLVWKLLTAVWHPVQFGGIVFLVLIFVLLEHESLRDRFIRVAHATDIRAATVALNDAGKRLSRYFVSQFAVNFAFGLAIWIGLSAFHLPQALLCGILAGSMRFIPYVGVALAALFAALLAMGVEPGWSLALCALGVFVLLDMVVGQLVEPHLFGHATGLSPLAVVVGAVFWSCLWGPAGLILSTPITLCLLVAGRHIKGLGALELLLGNAMPLTLPQRFYQRALSEDPHEILANARAFLKKSTLAAFFDCVLMPALHLAWLDAESGATTLDQQAKIRRVVINVAGALSGHRAQFSRRRRRGAVLEEISAGSWLRRQRELLSGKWQGPLGVASESIVICIGLGSPDDELAAEFLVRLLRSERIDARHFSIAELDAGLPAGADPNCIAIAFVVSAFPNPERSHADSVCSQLQQLAPQANLMKLFCSGVRTGSGNGNDDRSSTISSLEQAMSVCILRQELRRPAHRGDQEVHSLCGVHPAF